MRSVRVKAFAKINLTLRVLGRRPDGYHELRTTFQSLALHDSLTFTARPGRLAIECDDPSCPSDRTNLVWCAAVKLWRAAGRRGTPSGIRACIDKRIPLQAGLGGGSSDAAATLRALAAMWRLEIGADRLHRIASELGADVPYMLEGGTALGVERGDVLFPLADAPPCWVVLVVPSFGVSSKDAYEWWDRADRAADSVAARARPRRARDGTARHRLPSGELRNDLEEPVAARRPEIGRLVRSLERRGASYAAMSGSGSAVFGLFGSAAAAESAAGDLLGPGRRALVTRTISRAEFLASSRAAFR